MHFNGILRLELFSTNKNKMRKKPTDFFEKTYFFQNITLNCYRSKFVSESIISSYNNEIESKFWFFI